MIDIERAKLEFQHAGNENAILACIMKDITRFYEVEPRLSESDFLTVPTRAIWNIIRYLIRQDVKLDTTAILAQAESMDLLSKIPQAYDYISALFDKEVDTNNLSFYVDRVSDAGTKVKVLRVLNELEGMVEKNKNFSSDTLPATAIVDLAQSRFLEVSLEAQKASDAIDLGENIDLFIQELTSEEAGTMGLTTGFHRLDARLNGLEPGTLTVVGARPKVGKSALLLNWAAHIAYDLQMPVLYLDTEMSAREQKLRLLSILSGVPERSIKRGEFKNDSYATLRVQEAATIIKSGMIAHKYFPDFSAESIASITRKFYHQQGIGCLIFDYIKLSSDDLSRLGNVREHQSLGYLSSALKQVAGELNIPVVTAAQIGRVGANKGRITPADFADSDRVLRYANTLLGLSFKPKEELEKAEELFGRDIAWKMGSHRLQVLAARGGGEDFSGIDIHFRREILTVREADEQESERMKFEGGIDDPA